MTSTYTAQDVMNAIETTVPGRWYSGRGMFGYECPAFVYQDIRGLIDILFDIYEENPDVLDAMRKCIRTDAMGLRSIAYFPKFKRPGIRPEA